MKHAYFFNGSGVRVDLEVPDNAIDITEKINSGRAIDVMLEQNEEERKQNRRLFIVSIVSTMVSIGALVVSIFALVD